MYEWHGLIADRMPGDPIKDANKQDKQYPLSTWDFKTIPIQQQQQQKTFQSTQICKTISSVGCLLYSVI